MAAASASASSGWPWMKDSKVPNVTTMAPIAPASAGDDRPALVDLFAEHRAAIDQVAAELALSDVLYEPHKHDDLWIVRFLLSHKNNVKASVKAAQHALAVRAQYKLDDNDIRYCAIGPNMTDPAFQRYLKYCKDDVFQIVIPDAKLGVVGFLDLSGIDQHELVKNVDEADWAPTFLYVAEWSHQWADYLSRTSGRLTASVRIIDVGGVTLSGISSECQKRDGKAMKITEDCYPQMLKSVFVCHSPVWVQAVWRILRPLFPRRIVEKMDFISPDRNENERERLLKYISIENLPVKYGGKNTAWPLTFTLPRKADEDSEVVC